MIIAHGSIKDKKLTLKINDQEDFGRAKRFLLNAQNLSRHPDMGMKPFTVAVDDKKKQLTITCDSLLKTSQTIPTFSVQGFLERNGISLVLPPGQAIDPLSQPLLADEQVQPPTFRTGS